MKKVAKKQKNEYICKMKNVSTVLWKTNPIMKQYI